MSESLKHIELIKSVLEHDLSYPKLSPEGQEVYLYGLEELIEVMEEGVISNGYKLKGTFFFEAFNFVEQQVTDKKSIGHLTNLAQRIRNVDPRIQKSIKISINRSLQNAYGAMREGKDRYVPFQSVPFDINSGIWGEASGGSRSNGKVHWVGRGF